jgi:hypothetical protein
VRAVPDLEQVVAVAATPGVMFERFANAERERLNADRP